MFLPESGAPCPPFPYVTLGVPPSRSIRTLSRVVLLSGTADPGTCPSPLLHHVCPSRSQSTDTTMPNCWWPPSPRDSDEDEDYEDYEDEDLPHLDGYLDGYNRGYRDALRDNYPSEEEDEEGEEEEEEEDYEEGEEEEEEGHHRDQYNVKEDQDQDEHEQEDDGRPYSRSRTPRCSSRCKYYPCDRPIRSPRSSSPVVGPYRASESHLLESDYDSDAEENYVDIPVPPRS